MNISLCSFESVIDPVIISRGEEYFYNEAVCGLKQIKVGEWVASVDGTEVYKVCISLKDADIYNYSCSCPYDMGPVCKHVVAVLFAIRGGQEDNSKPPRKKQELGHKKTSRPKPAGETFEQVIARLPREDLNAIILDYAGREPSLVDHVFAHRTIKAPSSGKEEYRQIIQNAVDAVRGKHGFIGYWQASRAVDGAEMILEKAQELFEKEQSTKALPIFQCVLEEMVPLLQEADDSNGEIGGVIEDAFEGLSECARQAKDAGFRREMLDYLFKECGHQRYDEWSSWSWNFLSIAGEIVQSSEERDQLFHRIDEIEEEHSRDDSLSRYDSERASVIKMAVIERLGTKEDIETFLSQNLDCMPLRERAIDRALKRKDYMLAKKLAQDGLEQDKARGLPGLVNKWIQRLLDIVEAQRDQPEIKKYTLGLFLDTGNFDYYVRHKKCFTAKEWPEEAQRIIHFIKRSKNNRSAMSLPQIYIHEELWSDLMELVRKSNSSWALESFSKHLAPHFPDELAEVYEKVIVEKLAPPMGRGQYQYLCRFLRRLQKLGYKGRVKRLVDELSTKYSNRPAMLEELRRV